MIVLFVVVTTIALALALYTAFNDEDLRKADEIYPGIRWKVHKFMLFSITCLVVLFLLLLKESR